MGSILPRRREYIYRRRAEEMERPAEGYSLDSRYEVRRMVSVHTLGLSTSLAAATTCGTDVGRMCTGAELLDE